ncbi:restriction endonuclease subunit S [Absicoccus porci]|uniref:Restriction endonuclease subunit S n=1 Tax=Absicoccus porci TaxID=2486576 RepID=A0A3N0HWZ2_9FIRM|nr:restriction endonuclease subunit S [Absicoccus porci]RNM29188.1 restriction endonuclease subunit S [Absicoccus porci]
MKQPKLRFPEFTGDWKQHKFEDVVTIGSGKDYKHLESGNVPVYGTGGYMLSVNQALSESEDAVGIGRKGTIDKPYILRAPFWTVDTLFYCIPNEGFDLTFTNCLFQNVDWKKKDESTGVPSLSKVIINNVKTYVPSLEEQQKIASLFTELDSLIQSAEKELEGYRKLKQGMLQKMFPKKGEKVPEIRFPEFTGDWEQRKLGELCDITTGKLDANAMNPDGEYDFYTSGIDVYKIDKAAFSGPAITIAGNGANVGYLHLADGYFNAYQRTYILTNFLANRQFLYSSIGVTLPCKIYEEVRGSGVPYIVLNMLTDLVIQLPSQEEQFKIAEHFSNLDNLITIQQKEIDGYKELKKGLLQQMFC